LTTINLDPSLDPPEASAEDAAAEFEAGAASLEAVPELPPPHAASVNRPAAAATGPILERNMMNPFG
jgi:hypothetical protein